jgi:hypothetical protein
MIQLNHNGNRANTMGNFNPYATLMLPDRPIAYCPCGTRLSRLRPACTNLCWQCEQQKLAATTAIELHPSPHDCPTCGATIYRGANQCRPCYEAR